MRPRYIEELEKILGEYQIAKEDVCFVNSAILAVKDIRENRDLEFALRPSARESVLKNAEKFYYYNQYSGVIKFSEKIDCDQDLYRMFNIYDEDLFQDEHTEKYGKYRVIKPELLMASKVIWNREKDEVHQKIVKESSLWSEEFDRKVRAYVQVAVNNGWPKPIDRDVLWNDILSSEKDIYIFGMGYIGRHVYKRFVRECAADRMQGFLVSNREDGQSTMYGKPVYELSEVCKENSFVIVATGIQNLKENMNMLKSEGFCNIVEGYALYVG